MTPDLLPRNLAKKIQVNDRGCWIFTGAVQSSGYGSIAIDGNGTTKLAHRAAYELLVDRIPAGMTIDHFVCFNKLCCNPAHLEVVSRAENTRRAVENGLAYPALAARNAAKTHCDNGHEFTDENTYINREGHRTCRECRRVSDRKRLLRIAADPKLREARREYMRNYMAKRAAAKTESAAAAPVNAPDTPAAAPAAAGAFPGPSNTPG